MSGSSSLRSVAPPARPQAVLAVLCLSLLVVSIDNGILNVALPTLVRDVGASPSELQWIVDAYVLTFAGLLLTAGSLGDRFGRKRIMTIGLVIFGVASVGAAASSSPAGLVAWRAALGVGGALIMPATLSILVNVFTEPVRRAKAIASWSLMNAVGAFVGPITGGLLLRQFWWGSCFLINLPFVVAALMLGRRQVPESRDPDAARFDLTGATLSTAFLVALVWAIIEAPARGWSSPIIVGALVVAGLLLIAFVLWERRSRTPMLDLSVFRQSQLTAAGTAMTVAFLAMFGSMFLITQSLQLVKGYTPLVAALATSGPIVAMNLLVMPRTPGLTSRLGARWMITVGASSVACACLIISTATPDSAYVVLGSAFALMALGFSTFVPASTEAIMTAVPSEKAGGASAINQLTRQIGQALGIAVGGSIAASRYTATFPTEGIPLPAEALDTVAASITATLDAARSATGATRDQLVEAGHVAFMNGVHAATRTFAVVAVGAAIFAAVAIPSRVGRRTGNADRAPEIRAEGSEAAATAD